MRESKTYELGGDINPLFTFVLGLLLGWLIEWLIDYFYWRRRYSERDTEYRDHTATQVEIIGGPVCTPVGDRAYQWWQIRLLNSKEGWSAEWQRNSPAISYTPIHD